MSLWIDLWIRDVLKGPYHPARCEQCKLSYFWSYRRLYGVQYESTDTRQKTYLSSCQFWDYQKIRGQIPS